MRRRVLAVPRLRDRVPPGGTEVFAHGLNAIANDGAPHLISGGPAIASMIPAIPNSRVRLRWIRVEWQTIDPAIVPVLSVQVTVNSQPARGFDPIANLFLQPLAVGTPAMELTLQATEVAVGGSVFVTVTNAGTINPQIVSVYLWGWQYPDTARNGDGYNSPRAA